MVIFFSEKPIFYEGYACISFVGTKHNRKAHIRKTCPSLKLAKTIFSFRSKRDFDIIQCRRCAC